MWPLIQIIKKMLWLYDELILLLCIHDVCGLKKKSIVLIIITFSEMSKVMINKEEYEELWGRRNLYSWKLVNGQPGEKMSMDSVCICIILKYLHIYINCPPLYDSSGRLGYLLHFFLDQCIFFFWQKSLSFSTHF